MQARTRAPEFVGWLRRQIASRTPIAMARFGDGETKLLGASAEDGNALKIAQRQLERAANRACSPTIAFEVKAALEFAYREADVIGIPASVRLGEDPPTHPLARLYDERLSAANPPLQLTSSVLHHEILAELPDLLGGRLVSVISCRDVRAALEDKCGLESVIVYQIPSQGNVRHVDGAYEESMHDVPIWPDARDFLSSELLVRERGEVFLIGAGLFGKDLCIRVRDGGGIALDMGSALDHVAGKRARGSMRRLLELHESGMSAPDIANVLEGQIGERIEHDRIRAFIDGVMPYLGSSSDAGS